MSQPTNRPGFATRAIHAGQSPDPTTGAIMTPIYATSTYVQRRPASTRGSSIRAATTRHVSRWRIASPIWKMAPPARLRLRPGGDGHDLGTARQRRPCDRHGRSLWRQLSPVRECPAALGRAEFSFVDLSDPANLEAALTPKTKMIWVESPTNPLLKMVDLGAIAAFAKAHGLIAVCDNTLFAGGAAPLDHGIDIVMHSTTKYLNGHSDVVGGIAVVGDGRDGLRERLGYLQNAVGAVAGPFDSSGLAGLENPAGADATPLRERRRRRRLPGSAPQNREGLYPGCSIRNTPWPTPDAWFRRHGDGGFERRVGRRPAVFGRCELFALAESLGGVESLIEHPAIMTHASIPKKFANPSAFPTAWCAVGGHRGGRRPDRRTEGRPGQNRRDTRWDRLSRGRIKKNRVKIASSSPIKTSTSGQRGDNDLNQMVRRRLFLHAPPLGP